MPKIRLTQEAVDKRRPPATGRVDLFDRHLPSFGLRVGAGGHKAWFVFYRVGKLQRRYTIGTVKTIPGVVEARELARAVLRDVDRGIDPAIARDAPPPAPPLTVKELAADFIDRYAKPRNRSWHTTERVLALHVLPTWGSRDAASIARRDVHELLDRLVARGNPVVANRTLAAVRKMFNWAVEREILPASPAFSVKAPGQEVERDRVLDDDDLATVWRAAERLGGVAGAFVQLMVLTGQRRNEVAGMRWADVDLEKKLWTLPRQRTKADRSHEVPLSDLAMAVLTGLPRKGTYVLTSRGFRQVPGKHAAPDRLTDRDRPIGAYSKIKKTLDAKIVEILAEDAAEQGMTGWRFHDLRRSAATGMARLGVPIFTISRILNHAEGGVTRLYARYSYVDEKRHALDAWARHVEGLVRPTPDNVVILKASRRPAVKQAAKVIDYVANSVERINGRILGK
jgi:integrase